jgi:hypothetical protein
MWAVTIGICYYIVYAPMTLDEIFMTDVDTFPVHCRDFSYFVAIIDYKIKAGVDSPEHIRILIVIIYHKYMRCIAHHLTKIICIYAHSWYDVAGHDYPNAEIAWG